MTRRQKYGFTLLEVMVTVVILGILSTLAVLGFRKAIAHQTLISAKTQTLSALKYASDEARVSKRQIKVEFNCTQDTVRAWVDTDNDNVIDAGEAIIQKFGMPIGVDLVSAKYGSTITRTIQRFIFYEDGATLNDIIFVMKSITTMEYKALKIYKNTGWIEVEASVATNMK